MALKNQGFLRYIDKNCSCNFDGAKKMPFRKAKKQSFGINGMRKIFSIDRFAVTLRL